MSEHVSIYSAYGTDSGLADLVQWFVSKLPSRVLALDGAYRSGNLNELGRLAHQMKGAAGSYGFAQITDAAAELERAVRGSGSPVAIEQSLLRLTALCRQARAGQPT